MRRVPLQIHSRDDARSQRRLACLLILPVLIAACQTSAIPYAPGTPEYAAALVSRGYDCGVRVDRSRIVQPMDREERRRFIGTGQVLSVRAYNAPRGCGAVERAMVASELRSAAGR